MPMGTVKKLVHDKGYGFIQTQQGTDVFFHHSTVEARGFDRLSEGQQVEYQLDPSGGPGGKPRARSVVPA